MCINRGRKMHMKVECPEAKCQIPYSSITGIMWVLGTELGSSERAIYILAHWAISLDHLFHIFSQIYLWNQTCIHSNSKIIQIENKLKIIPTLARQMKLQLKLVSTYLNRKEENLSSPLYGHKIQRIFYLFQRNKRYFL